VNKWNYLDFKTTDKYVSSLGVETVEEYLKRGGKITLIEFIGGQLKTRKVGRKAYEKRSCRASCRPSSTFC